MEGGCPFKAMLGRSGPDKAPQQEDETPGTGVGQVLVGSASHSGRKYRNKLSPNNNNNNNNTNNTHNNNESDGSRKGEGSAEDGRTEGEEGGESDRLQIASATDTTTSFTTGTCLPSSSSCSSSATIPTPSIAVSITGLVTPCIGLPQDVEQATRTINIDPWPTTPIAGARRLAQANNLSISMNSPDRSYTPDSAGTSSPVSPYGTPSREHPLYQRHNQNNGQVSNRPASCGTPTSTSPGKRQRKISNISTASSSAGSETELGQDGHTERRLELRGLIEAVGTLILPTMCFMNRALENLINETEAIAEKIKDEIDIDWEKFGLSTCDPEARYVDYDDDLVVKIVSATARLSGSRTFNEQLQKLGVEYFKICAQEYGRSLRSVGSNLLEFYSNIDGLHGHIWNSSEFRSRVPPSFRCATEGGKLVVHLYTDRPQMRHYMAGVVLATGVILFSVPDLTVEVSQYNKPSQQIHHVIITLWKTGTDCSNIVSPTSTTASPTTICSSRLIPTHEESMMTPASSSSSAPNGPSLLPEHHNLSNQPSDSKISVMTFCKTFPFHVIFDRNLHITQLGSALMKMIAPNISTKGLFFGTYFELVRPRVKMDYMSFLSRVNSTFVLCTTQFARGCDAINEQMELKGQMIHLPESDAILFIGSPSVEKLDEMIGKGIYISDIPIHDATRDVILVGEQSKAQDGLKKRMEQVRRSVVEASEAVKEEREKNVALLQNIFPSAVAQKLWRGETVEPTKVNDVTMLFSDIVGFTAICSSCKPMMVVNMLNALYTQFDTFCGILDVYKIETIGDAYCVVGGLHRPSQYHAQQIAWMALKMMEASQTQKSHDGKAIEMRIGVHSGSVLAGVVGTKMPRYCLFGNNVTLANKFESGSVAKHINVSPTSYELLKDTPGFQFSARSRSDLPNGFPDYIEGVPYFLVGYVHPDVCEEPDEDQIDHIALAVDSFHIKNS